MTFLASAFGSEFVTGHLFGALGWLFVIAAVVGLALVALSKGGK